MTDPAPLSLSGQRLAAVYELTCPDDQAETRARDICLEQTVEFPEDRIPRQEIRDQIVGRIASIETFGPDRHRAVIEYPIEAAGEEFPQLINLLFGNISIKPGVRLVRFELPPSMLNTYRGPRFGQSGLRRRLGSRPGPLVCTAIKPMGLGPEELADLTYRLALGGIDLIKDDHGLADQPFCRFAPRVQLCSAAVQRANSQTGGNCVYVPNVTGPTQLILPRAHLAKRAGAGGLLFLPGLAGLDTMRWLADQDDLCLPILAHPAFQGPYTMRGDEGISHGALYGQLNRLAGADAVIFPNFGGRFSFTPEQCRDLVDGCTCAMGHLPTVFPVPAGGMRVERVPELYEFYGDDCILLVGGDLHRHGSDLTENCRRLIEMVRLGSGLDL